MNSVTRNTAAGNCVEITPDPAPNLFPFEVVDNIFTHVRWQDFFRLSLTCKRMNSLVNRVGFKIPLMLRHGGVEYFAEYFRLFLTTAGGGWIQQDDTSKKRLSEILRVFIQSTSVKQEKQWWKAYRTFVNVDRIMELLPETLRTFVFNHSYLHNMREVEAAFQEPNRFRHLCEVEIDIEETRGGDDIALPLLQQFLTNFRALRSLTIRHFPITFIPLPEKETLSRLKVCFQSRGIERTKWLLDILSRSNPLDRLVVRESEPQSAPAATNALMAAPFPTCMSKLKCFKVYSDRVFSIFLLKAAFSNNNRATVEVLECSADSCRMLWADEDFDTLVKPRLSSLRALTVIVPDRNMVGLALFCSTCPALRLLKIKWIGNQPTLAERGDIEQNVRTSFSELPVAVKIVVDYHLTSEYQVKSNRKPYQSSTIIPLEF